MSNFHALSPRYDIPSQACDIFNVLSLSPSATACVCGSMPRPFEIFPCLTLDLLQGSEQHACPGIFTHVLHDHYDFPDGFDLTRQSETCVLAISVGYKCAGAPARLQVPT